MCICYTNSMNIKVIKEPNNILSKRAKLVEIPLSEEDRNMAFEMRKYIINSQDAEYLEKHPSLRPGIGLAAPQIGQSKRIICIYLPNADGITDLLLANPIITKESVKKSYLPSGEGCLSVDRQVEGLVFRSKAITVKAYDIINDVDIEFSADGLLSIALQHEIDHLNGTLFFQRINKDNPFLVIDNVEVCN